MYQQTVEPAITRAMMSRVERSAPQMAPSPSYRRLKIETNRTGEFDVDIDEESPEIDSRIDDRIRRLVQGFDQSGDFATVRVELTCGSRREVLYEGAISFRDTERVYRFFDSWRRLKQATQVCPEQKGAH